MKTAPVLLALSLLACHGGEEDLDAGAGADATPRVCSPLTDTGCIAIQVGETISYRFLGDPASFTFDDEGTARTVVRLSDLIDADIVADPATQRFQITGTDGYTIAGYATWENMQNGYIELGTRKCVWETSQGLPRGFRVADAYLITLSPA